MAADDDEFLSPSGLPLARSPVRRREVISFSPQVAVRSLAKAFESASEDSEAGSSISRDPSISSICGELQVLEGMGEALPGPAVPLRDMPREQDCLSMASFSGDAWNVSSQKLALLPEADDVHRVGCGLFHVSRQQKLSLLPEADDALGLCPEGFICSRLHVAATVC
eukprot:TRINITY_DN14385_c0_g1_i1.p2 TRINITY_DN14385_c0_g1~~TRINITY_DN14385_c0_g1_i1.p2  ORF type:complete len:167 (-),score=33.68 TRINITY_DN14385_c0_g1_i1:177-677(-)